MEICESCGEILPCHCRPLIVGWRDDDMFNDHPGVPPDPGPDPYGEPEITTVNLPGD